jgi:hypothetical protein
VPAMKLTPNVAMRARDVSRPRDEHLAAAEAAEAARGTTARAAPAGGPEPAEPTAGEGRRSSRQRRSWTGGGRDAGRRRTGSS